MKLTPCMAKQGAPGEFHSMGVSPWHQRWKLNDGVTEATATCLGKSSESPGSPASPVPPKAGDSELPDGI